MAVGGSGGGGCGAVGNCGVAGGEVHVHVGCEVALYAVCGVVGVGKDDEAGHAAEVCAGAGAAGEASVGGDPGHPALGVATEGRGCSVGGYGGGGGGRCGGGVGWGGGLRVVDNPEEVAWIGAIAILEDLCLGILECVSIWD